MKVVYEDCVLMTRKIVVWMCAVLLGGCYDLSTNYDNHVITEFRILAIHAEPPAILPDTPVEISVLYADASGETVPVSAAWRTVFFSGGDDESCFQTGLFVSTPPALPGLTLSPPSASRGTDKGIAPSFLLDLYLCTSTFDNPARILRASDEELIEKLCPGGTLALGQKEVKTYLLSDFAGVSDWITGNPGIRLVQQNPLIDTLTANGRPVTAIEDGGGIVPLCDDPTACEAVMISVTLDPASLDQEPVSSARWLPDGGDDVDAGELIGVVWESHMIDWYVTGGTLSNTSFFFKGGLLSADEPPSLDASETEWRFPGTDTPSVYTLYVVVRDDRGGNSWKTYRFSVGTP